MKALGDTVFVRPFDPEKVRESGLVIPDSASDRPTSGEVVSVGERSPVRVGMHVMFSRHAGQEVEVDGEKLILLKARDLLAVLDA